VSGLLIAWMLFPLVLGALSLGCGLLVEAASGIRLRGALLLPTGFAAIIVIAQLVTLSPRTARYAPWVVAAVAVAGLLLPRPWQDRRPGPWPAAAAVGTFAAFAAPIVLSGSATFAGWIKLDDGANWLAITDRVMFHGRSMAGVPLSTYEILLKGYLNTGYPVGSFLPLGVAGRLVGEELAWLIQPYMAFAVAMLTLAVYGLVSRALDSRALRALTAFVATQSALLYGYVLWGGLKEAAATALIALTAALMPTLLERRVSPRAAIPLAVATAATIGSLSVSGGLLWLVPILLPGLVLAVRARRAAITVRIGAVLGAVALLFGIPAIAVAVRFVSTSRSVLTSNQEFGNLFHPLRFAQIFGIWPTGDFRFDPDQLVITYVLIAVAALAAVGGVIYAWRRGAPEPALYVASAALGAAVGGVLGSPWVEGKAFTIASPAFLAAAAVGGSMLIERGRRSDERASVLVGAAAVVALVVGALWSNVLAYHDVRLAPRDQLEELVTIGKRSPAEGPALMLEPSPYGGLYFLRRLAPEIPSMYRSRPIFLRGQRVLGKLGYADIDAFPLPSILPYRTLVLNRTANASRPPSIYRLVWHGTYYEVWQRPRKVRRPIIAHVPQGRFNQPATVPSCPTVRALAAVARRAGGTLATVIRPPAIVVSLSDTRHPPTWQTYRDSPGLIYPHTAGTLTTTLSIPTAGSYGVWLGGSFQRALEVWIDRKKLSKKRHRLNNNGAYTPFGKIVLTPGTHDVTLIYTSATLYPGSGGRAQFQLGPLVLGKDTADLPVKIVKPANARSLCGKSLDWVEAVRR
jgi:hypothetical protein